MNRIGINTNELLEDSEKYTGVANAISLRDAKVPFSVAFHLLKLLVQGFTGTERKGSCRRAGRT